MPFNRLDSEMLLNSINNLGQSFAGARREKAEEDYRTAARKSSEQHYAAEEQHYKNVENKQDAILKNQQVQNAINVMNKQFESLRQTAPDDDTFNKAARAFIQQHQDTTDAILGNSAFAPWASDPEFRGTKTTIPQMTPAMIGNRQAAIGPRGSVHFTDELSGPDKAELGNINAQLREIEKQSLELAKNPNPDASRNLNTRRQRLESQKQAITQKYQQNGGQSSTNAPAGATQDPNVLRQQAQQAISSGKDPAAVRARFKQITGQDL